MIRIKFLRTFNLIFTRLADRAESMYYAAYLRVAGAPAVFSIHTHMTRKELFSLYQLALHHSSAPRMLEIGSYIGASSCFLGGALSRNGGHLYCVDTWQNQTMREEYDTWPEFEKNTKPFKDIITPVRKYSHELTYEDIGSQPLDIAFIDGDHSYEGVQNDYKLIGPWVKPGGLLIFHDCLYWEGVWRTIGEALASGDWQFLGQEQNLLWMRKIVRTKKSDSKAD